MYLCSGSWTSSATLYSRAAPVSSSDRRLGNRNGNRAVRKRPSPSSMITGTRCRRTVPRASPRAGLSPRRRGEILEVQVQSMADRPRPAVSARVPTASPGRSTVRSGSLACRTEVKISRDDGCENQASRQMAPSPRESELRPDRRIFAPPPSTFHERIIARQDVDNLVGGGDRDLSRGR